MNYIIDDGRISLVRFDNIRCQGCKAIVGQENSGTFLIKNNTAIYEKNKLTIRCGKCKVLTVIDMSVIPRKYLIAM